MPREHWVRATGIERVIIGAEPMNMDEQVAEEEAADEEVAEKEETVTLGISQYRAI